MFNIFGNKSGDLVSGKVERVGATGYKGDVFYMTLLLYGNNRIYTVFFEQNDSKNNAASLTQSGDDVQFLVSEYGQVKNADFLNETITERLKQAETVVVKTF